MSMTVQEPNRAATAGSGGQRPKGDGPGRADTDPAAAPFSTEQPRIAPHASDDSTAHKQRRAVCLPAGRPLSGL
jgi:hypothetical protein